MLRNRWLGAVAGILVVMVLLAPGCSRSVRTTNLVNKDLGQYRTYAWLPSGDTLNAFEKDPTIAKEIRDRINAELQAKGFRPDTVNPDFLVLVHTRYNEEVEPHMVPPEYNYYGPGFYTGPPYQYYYL